MRCFQVLVGHYKNHQGEGLCLHYDVGRTCENIGEHVRTLGNIGECWRTCENFREHVRTLENVGEHRRTLENM